MCRDVEDRAEIVITGLGVAACLGLDLESIWQRVKRGECGIGPMPALETPLPPDKDGGQTPDLPATFLPDATREARYLRWTIDAALRQAGWLSTTDGADRLSTIDPLRVSILLGTTLHGMRSGGAFLRTGDFSYLKTFLAGDTIREATAGLPIGGLSATTCSACSSSLGAIALAVTLLQRGEADLIIAGGYDAVSEYAYAGFGSLRLISNSPLRPFARDRGGMKVAEGYGIVVLERRADAKARGASPRAIVAGWGESADAFHLTRPHPQGSGALAAMKQAIDRAGIDATRLDLIAAHATGTPDNDSSEAAAITALLGSASNAMPVVGFKSHLGHTLGGAGAIELALSTMAIRDEVVPPTANSTRDRVEYDTIKLSVAATHGVITHTLNTSLGFGGANTCIVLRRPDDASAGVVARANPSHDDVVITGIGVLLPGAIGNDAFAALLRAATPIAQRTIEEAVLESLIPNARRLRRMSTYVKLSICAAAMAARDAALADGSDALRNTGAILGTTHGSAAYCYDYYAQIIREGLSAANPMLFAEGVPNAAAAQLSLMFGMTGSCQTLLGTRKAGLDALFLAAARIANHDADRLIVCAAEESFHILDGAYASCGGPASVSTATAFVVERRSVALARNARLIATIGNAKSRTQCQPAEVAAFANPIRFVGGSGFSVEPLLAVAAGLLGGRTDSFIVGATDRDASTTVEIVPEHASEPPLR